MQTCGRCGGKGQYMGVGYIMTDCNLCNVDIEEIPFLSIDKINRKSKSYQDAVKEIMTINKVSKKEAVKMFDEAYQKGS